MSAARHVPCECPECRRLLAIGAWVQANEPHPLNAVYAAPGSATVYRHAALAAGDAEAGR